jgi:hypothetical protein
MNYLEKKNAYKRNMGLFRATSGEGCVKYSNETIEHFTVKCQVLHYMKKSGWSCWCEPVLNGNKGRPDLIALHKNGDIYAIEVLKSETEKRFNEKDYPIPIIKVYVKGFDYNKFCI